MKAVLMSIHRKWCELIFSGEKTIEMREIVPNLETPYKVYVYQTKHKGKSIVSEALNAVYGGGKVVGEFVCDQVDEYTFSSYEAQYRINDVDLTKTCLNHPELKTYGRGKTLRGLHITEPKRYDQPKELYEFIKACDFQSNCGVCTRKKYLIEDGKAQFMGCDKRIYRAPQSWMYVEEVEE